MDGPFAVVLNCRSRHALEARGRIVAAFAARGVEAHLCCAEGDADPATLARAAADGAFRAVLAAGGDGTVNAVARALAGTAVPLGVLPLGTVNHFARHLGVPTALDGAVDALLGADTAAMDLGEVNGRLFVNNVTFGMYPCVVRHRDRLHRERGVEKWLAFGWAVASALRHAAPARVRLALDGRWREVETPFVFVGTYDHTLGALALADGPPPDGALGVCVATPRGRAATASLVAAALAGRLAGRRDFEVLAARELRLAPPSPRSLVTTDGEVVALDGPLVFRVRPRALTVLAPRRYPRTSTTSPRLDARQSHARNW